MLDQAVDRRIGRGSSRLPKIPPRSVLSWLKGSKTCPEAKCVREAVWKHSYFGKKKRNFTKIRVPKHPTEIEQRQGHPPAVRLFYIPARSHAPV